MVCNVQPLPSSEFGISPPVRSAFFWVLLGFLLLAGCAGPAPRGITTTASPAALPLEQPVTLTLEPYAGRLKQVQVRVGEHTFPFLFDTGGGLTLVSPEVATLAGCTPYGRLTGYRMSGEAVHFEQCGEVPLGIGPLTLIPQVGVFDLMALLPEELPPLHGVLSLHTFREYPITLDLGGGELTLETPRTLQARVETMCPMRLSVEREIEGRAVAAYVGAEALQGELLLLLDSGNLAGVLLAPHAFEQLGLSEQLEPEGKEASQHHRVILHLPELGEIEVEARVEPLRHDGVLGAEFLEGVVLSLDVATGRMWGQRR